MARKRSARRPAKKTRKATVKQKTVAKKKPPKRKPPRKKASARPVTKKMPVAGTYAGEPPTTYVTGGTIPPPAP
jgi:hypothetical protein